VKRKRERERESWISYLDLTIPFWRMRRSGVRLKKNTGP
jgi:hypothetical protein